jgi:hypothetical protein
MTTSSFMNFARFVNEIKRLSVTVRVKCIALL